MDAEDAYVKKRIDILDTLIKNTPKHYRAKDGIFEKAKILWEYGQWKQDSKLQSDALKLWYQIPKIPNNGDFLNKEAFETIQLLLREM
jgi:hypothetical protein